MPNRPLPTDILAIGGGGFVEGIPSAQDRYLVELAQIKGSPTRPVAIFLPQASGESPDYIARFEKAYQSLGCETRVLSLFKPPTADLARWLSEADLIYVGGGNTKSMLALWREWQVDQILAELGAGGTPLAGLSAGSICWFEMGITDSIPGPLTPLPCLGWLPGTCCPHFDGEAERQPAFYHMLKASLVPDGWALDDGAALHFRHGEPFRVVLDPAYPTARVYRMTLKEGSVHQSAYAT